MFYLIEFEKSDDVCPNFKILQVFAIDFEVRVIAEAIWVLVLLIFNNFEMNCQFSSTQYIYFFEIVLLSVLVNLPECYLNLSLTDMLDID